MIRSATAILISVAVASTLGACTTKPILRPGVRPSVEVGPPLKSETWKSVATAEDKNRLERLDAAWEEALSEASRSNRAEIRREGKLLQPASGLPRPELTPGSYNCRLIKIGKARPKTRAFESFKPFFCYVEVQDNQLTIVKQTGSQRPVGLLWEDDTPTRLIFLGSLALGDETTPLAYGDDPKRNMAGVLERIAPFKWRLVIPWPQSTSKLDIFELTPVAQQPAG
ncbi:MAG TPA: DUF4893 domain-containing protein [Sphingomicrobium sp.]